MTTVPHWTGLVLSAPVSEIAHLVALPQAEHSSVWVLVSPDGGQATLIATDDLELDVWCRTDISSWDRVFGITHRDNMLSRARCRFIASLLREDLVRAGIEVPAYDRVDLPEATEADMRLFHRLTVVALRSAGLLAEMDIDPDGAAENERNEK